MPYNPGIQDISGQLIAQGMSQAGAARAQAIQSIGQSITGGIKQYQQNQFLTKQALGKFSGQMADPNFADFVRKAMADEPNTPISAELKTALKNVSAGKSDVYDAGVLAAFTDAYQDNMRGQLMQAQIDRAKFETDQARANMRRQSLLSQMLGLSQEEPTGMPAAASAVAVPGTQPSMPRAAAPAAAPAEQPAEAPAPTRAAAAPSMAPPLALSAQPQRAAAPATVAGAPATAVPPNLAQYLNRPLGAFPPEIAKAARSEVLMRFYSKGEISDPTMVAQRLAVEQRKQQAEEREMTFDEANNAAKTFNTSQLELPYGQRRFASVEPTTRPGFSALKIGLAEMTQAEKEASAAQTEDEKLRLGRINTNIIEIGRAHV